MPCCCNTCDSQCSPTDEWNGRCCNWESYPPEMSNMFDGLVIDFGPTDILISGDPSTSAAYRSEIIDLPGSYTTAGLYCSVVRPGSLGSSSIYGSAYISFVYSNFQIALRRSVQTSSSLGGPARCFNTYSVWFGLRASVSMVTACTIAYYSNSRELFRTTDPLDVLRADASGTLGGVSYLWPCDGTSGPQYGTTIEGSGCGDPIYLPFGIAAPTNIPASIKPPPQYTYLDPSFLTCTVSCPGWIGCGVRGVFNGNGSSSGIMTVHSDPTKEKITIKRSTSWGQCANLPINPLPPVSIQRSGIGLNNGIQLTP